jgi:hypothetical protein
VVLNDELRSDRRAETQRKGSCAIQFFIRELAYCGGRLMTVPTQKFERGCLRYRSMLVGMLGIQLGDHIPRDFHNGLAAGDCSRDINFDRVHAGNMVHDYASRTTVRRRHWRAPFLFGESISKGSQDGSTFLDAISQ